MTSATRQFYLSTYFIVNALLLFVYPILRLFTSAGRRDLTRQDSYGFSFQNSIIYTILLITITRYTVASSPSGFIVQVLSVGKIGIICLLIFAKFRFAIIYTVVCAILWLITPYPRYQAPNKFIRIKSIEQFDQIINSYEKSKQVVHKKGTKNNEQQQCQSFQYQDKYMYFIEFYADWTIPCILNKEIWYKYSMKYSTERLKFLQINVSRLPELAKRYKINSSGFSKQLPTVLIVTNGEEQVRFPPIDENNKVTKIKKYDYKGLLRYLDLEARYLETRQFLPLNQSRQAYAENSSQREKYL